MNRHQTPLSMHFKEKHLWFDLSLLFVLWGLVYFTPDYFWHNGEVSLNFFIKVLALVATLEFISFLSFHLMSYKNSSLLQGFLGGFISSTTTFMQLNYDLKFRSIDDYTRAQALLLAICSMLIECILIVIIVTNNFSIKMLIPLITMLIFIVIAIFILKKKENSSILISDNIMNMEIDHPILWKSVIRFSLYIAFLKYLLLLIQKNTSIPDLVGVFLASIFEAHATIAIKMGEMNSANTISEIYNVIIIILIGSTISKMFFVVRGKMLHKKRLVIIPTMFALIMTIITIIFLRKMSYVT